MLKLKLIICLILALTWSWVAWEIGAGYVLVVGVGLVSFLCGFCFLGLFEIAREDHVRRRLRE